PSWSRSGKKHTTRCRAAGNRPRSRRASHTRPAVRTGERPMQRIHRPWDLLEAHLRRDPLASAGSHARMPAEHLSAASGALPASGLLALLVEDEHSERARELLAAYTSAEPLLPAEEPTSGPGELLC